MPERAWFFSLRTGDLCLWKDQAALKWDIKNQRYLQSIPSGILCGSDEVKIAQSKRQRCDTLRNTQPIKVLVWAQRSFTSWIAPCRSHNAAFFPPLICWFIKHSVHIYWGVKTTSLLLWTTDEWGFLNTKQCESVLWKTRLVGDSHETNIRFSIWKETLKKSKQNSFFQMMDMLFKFFFLSLYQKVSVNFSVTDVQPTSESWLLIPFIFYEFLILYLNFIYSVKQ